MRSIQVNIDRPELHDQPDQLLALPVDSQGIGDQGTVTDFSSYFHAVNCATLPFKPKMTVSQVGRQERPARRPNPALQFDLRTRPGDANIKSLAVTLSNAFEIDQRHLGNICSRERAGRERVRRPHARSARRRRRRRCSTSRSPARSTRSRLRRPAAAGLHPQRPGQPGAAGRHRDRSRRPPEDDRPGRPRRPDRPLPPDRLRRQDRLPGQHPRPLRAHAR